MGEENDWGSHSTRTYPLDKRVPIMEPRKKVACPLAARATWYVGYGSRARQDEKKCYKKRQRAWDKRKILEGLQEE